MPFVQTTGCTPTLAGHACPIGQRPATDSIPRHHDLEGTMRRLFRTAALSLPFMLSVVAVDAQVPQVLYTSKRQQPLPLSNVGDPANVAKARLFVTTDNGKTWVMAHELQIPAGTKDLPKFPFQTDRDGAFGIMPCITLRSGQSEPEPKPGQAPPYVLVVDTAAPTIATFDATLMGRATAKVVLRTTWSVMDPNLMDKEPIAIEASSDGGARFTTIHRGGGDGAMELTVPVTAETSELQLRLVATDRARNVTVSPSRNLKLEPMGEPEKPAPLDPKDALAKAAATLPTLAEVGANEGKPLPTTPIAPPSQENPTAPVAPKPGSVATAAAAPVQAPAATPQAPATAPTAPTTRPDVVVDGKPYVAPTTPAPAAPAPASEPAVVVGDNSIDQAYYEALAASRPVAMPVNPKTAPRPVAQPAQPAPAPTRVDGDGQRLPPSAAPVYVKDEVKTLADARILATTGHLDDACDLYERLRFSSLGKTALTEQVKLLIANARPRDALTAIVSAPIEIITDPVRIEHGQLLLRFERAHEVELAVSGVDASGPDGRRAMLLIAKSYRLLGRMTESQRAFDYLARGKDEVAAEARALSGR